MITMRINTRNVHLARLQGQSSSSKENNHQANEWLIKHMKSFVINNNKFVSANFKLK